MVMPGETFRGRRGARGGVIVPGASNLGRFPVGERLTPRGLLAAAEARKRLLEQERQLGLEDDQFVLQAEFRARGLQALFDRARRTTPIDTGRLRSSMRLKPSRFIATLSWNTPYATAREYMRGVAPYVERAARAGAGSANAKRPRRLVGRVRNFHWQGKRTTRPSEYRRGSGRISTRITIPAAPGDRRRGSAMVGRRTRAAAIVRDHRRRGLF